MHKVGHHGAAMLGYAPIIALLDPGHRWLAILGLPVALFAARLPDVDQRLPFVPHRGPTHTIWFALVLGLGAMVAFQAVIPEGPLLVRTGVACVLSFGVLTHLASDAITPAGVRPFWPIWNRSIALPLCRAEDPVANWLLFVGGLFAIAGVLTASNIPLPVHPGPDPAVTLKAFHPEPTIGA